MPTVEDAPLGRQIPVRKGSLGATRAGTRSFTNIAPVKRELKSFLSKVDMVLWDLSNSRFITAERDLLGPVQDLLEELENGSALSLGEKSIVRHKFDDAMGIYKQILKQAQAVN